MTLESILECWKKDSEIDEIQLDRATLECAKMHSKYLELYTHAKLRLKKKDYDHAVLLKNKWLYYTGRMTKEEMDELGWPYDPFKGASKPMKGELNHYYDSDDDILKSKLGIDLQTSIVETCKEILDTLKWRHTNIKNILEFRKFAAGA